MGGDGSGRKPGTEKVIGNLLGYNQPVQHDDETAGQFVLPNYSGVQTAALKTSAPIGGGSGTPGGSDTQVQFNDAGSFGGDAGLTYDKTTDTLTTETLQISTSGRFSNDGSGNLLVESNSGNIYFDADSTVVAPNIDNFIQLGEAGKTWANLLLGNGGVVNFNAGDITLTHSADTLTLAGGTLVTNDIALTSGSGVRTRTTAGNTVLFQARDTDDNVYRTFATLTANATPTFDLSGGVTISGATIANITYPQTFTNKTINLANNTVTGTVAQFNTALSDGNFLTDASLFAVSGAYVPMAVSGGFVSLSGALITNGTITATSGAFDAACTDANFSYTTHVHPTYTSGALTFVFDGGGAVLSSGAIMDILVPFNCTLNTATILPNVSGSVTFGVWKDTYANFPPTSADALHSGGVRLNANTKFQDTTLSAWNKTITQGDTIRVNVSGASSTLTKATLILNYTR